MSAQEEIDWSESPLVEIRPEVLSGAPVLRYANAVNAIVDNHAYGVTVAEIAEQFEISPERLKAILAYAKDHRAARPAFQEG